MCHCCVFCMMVNSVVISLLLIICVLENLKIIFVVLKIWKSHFCCSENLKLSFWLYWKSETLIFVVLKIWNSHFCCSENLKLSFWLYWKSETLIFVVLKIWNSHFCCSENLKLSFLLYWKSETLIFLYVYHFMLESCQLLLIEGFDIAGTLTCFQSFEKSCVIYKCQRSRLVKLGLVPPLV